MKFDIRITNLNELKKEINQQISDRYLKQVMIRAQRNALTKIKGALMGAFERTLLFQALKGYYRGDENLDAPAHLGMTDKFAKMAVQEILGAIKQNFELESVVTSREGVIGFRATIADLTTVIENIPDAYKTIYSERSGEDLPWLDWVINGGSNIDYAINFYAERLKSPPNRSGRATMQDLGTLDWDIETYNRFAQGENFIQDAVLDPQWQEESVSIITRTIQDEMDKLNE